MFIASIHHQDPHHDLTQTQPTDLVNQSIPFSYLAVEVVANDGNSHQAQLYTDVTGGWLVPGNTQPQSDQLIKWETVTGDAVSHQVSLQSQTQLLEIGGRVRYGTPVYSTKQVCGFLCESLSESSQKYFRPTA